MNDRAPEVAAYFVERDADDIDPADLWIEVLQRWPDLTVEEGDRAAQIAAEILAAGIAEQRAEHAAIKAVFAQRGAVAQAVAHFGEAEFREIAEGSGIPLDAIRTCMQAIQRGEPLPPADDEPQEETP